MVRRASRYMAALVLVLGGAVMAWGQSVPGATLTVGGPGEQNSGSVWDTGSISVTVNGYVKTLSGYGQYSTPASLASWLSARLSADTNSPVWAKATGAVITLVARTGETVTASGTTTYDTGHFGTPSFTFTAGSTSVTPTPYLSLHCTRTTMGTGEHANCVAEIEGASALYGAPAATSDIVFTINSGPWVSVPVSPDGSATAMGLTEASMGTYIIRADYPGDSYYSAMHATTTVAVGSPATLTGVYSYSITDSSSGSGYDPAGNIVAYADLIQGQWTLSYDSLNRLKGASSSPAIISGMPNLCWSYDSFGNRKQQYLGAGSFSGGGTTACSGGGSSPAMQDQTYGTNNRLASDSTISTSFGFDASGEMTSDGSGTHQYSYDAEGRVCAMAVGISEIHYYGYLYDAEGRRVAKGTISSLDCSLVTGDGFTVTEAYIIGPDGSTMTELDGSGGWKHTDVPAGPGTMAVYDDSGLHFRFSDWLGSHRVQTNFNAATVEDTYQNLPFGEPIGSMGGATEKHFTGKERDAESGNDYFGARYYGSTMGRFMSPDWNADPVAIPYASNSDPQSLNLYSYAGNNPFSRSDPDGHCWKLLSFSQHLCNAADGYGWVSDQRRDEVIDWERKQLEQAGIYEIDGEGRKTTVDWSKADPKMVQNVFSKVSIAAISSVASKPINLPAWKTIDIDMEHVVSGHTAGGGRVGPGSQKDLFPETWDEGQIEKAIREAYKNGKKISSTAADGRVLVEGVGGGRTIQMWVNTAEKTIETAWPK